MEVSRIPIRKVLNVLVGEGLFQVEGTGHINVNFCEQEGNYIIHLVNLSGCNCQPGCCEETLPVGPVSVRFHSDYTGALKARCTVAEETIILTSEDNMKSFLLKTLYDHEMIVIERV